MAGLGKYKKGAKFTLKSGNKPTFTQMGSSPANLNNFGIGPGGSPYKQGDENDEDKGKKETVRRTGGDIKPGEDTKAGDVKEPAWKKAIKVGTTLLSGGIQGVYGGTREAPQINWGKWTQEELDEQPGAKIAKDILTQEEKDAGLSLYEGKKQSKAVE
jgi:hypothetical protein